MTKTTKVEIMLINGVVHKQLADGTYAPIKGQSDWARVDATTEEELARQIAEDEDAPNLSDDDWAEALEERRQRLAQHDPDHKFKLG